MINEGRMQQTIKISLIMCINMALKWETIRIKLNMIISYYDKNI